MIINLIIIWIILFFTIIVTTFRKDIEIYIVILLLLVWVISIWLIYFNIVFWILFFVITNIIINIPKNIYESIVSNFSLLFLKKEKDIKTKWLNLEWSHEKYNKIIKVYIDIYKEINKEKLLFNYILSFFSLIYFPFIYLIYIIYY